MSGAGGERAGDEAAGPGRDPGGDDLVVVALAVKVRGVRGEVVADLLTDFPERFEGLRELTAVFPGGRRGRLALEGHWFHGGRVVLKFAGYDAPETAAALVGCQLAVPESEAVALEEGRFYDWQLEGCRAVTVDGREIGTVREVLRTGGESPVLLVRDERGRENLLPFVESICVEVDTARKEIRVDAPEGLLE